MLNRAVAEEFIQNLEQFSNFEISILDHNGIVIFSTNNGRQSYETLNIQQFQKAQSKQISFKIQHTDGIAVPLLQENQAVGFMVIIGILNEIEPISYALKMAFEIRLKYEDSLRKEKETLSSNEQIISDLINYTSQKEESIQANFKQAGYKLGLPRIMLFLEPQQSTFLDTLANTNFFYDSNEDIIAAYQSHVVILKDCSKLQTAYDIHYISDYISYIKENTIFDGNVYVAQPQVHYRQFSDNYEELTWLCDKLSIFETLSKRNLYFIKDYLHWYFMSKTPFVMYQKFYTPILEKNKNFDKEEFLSYALIVIQNNYNLSQSSKELFMHKNTLIYKMDKVKRIFLIDPINSEADRCFFRSLYYYLVVRDSKGVQ